MKNLSFEQDAHEVMVDIVKSFSREECIKLGLYCFDLIKNKFTERIDDNELIKNAIEICRMKTAINQNASSEEKKHNRIESVASAIKINMLAKKYDPISHVNHYILMTLAMTSACVYSNDFHDFAATAVIISLHVSPIEKEIFGFINEIETKINEKKSLLLLEYERLQDEAQAEQIQY